MRVEKNMYLCVCKIYTYVYMYVNMHIGICVYGYISVVG